MNARAQAAEGPGDSGPSAGHDLLVWLVRLRWVAVLGQTLGILAGEALIPEGLRLGPLFLLVAAGVVTNALLAWRLRDPRSVREAVPGFILALDSLQLTGLLYLAGGPSNPFTAIYLVHITLAAVVMRGYWAWGLCILSTLGFCLLFFRHVHVHALMMMPHEAGAFSLHLIGMLAAFAVTAALIAVFAGRVSQALRRREREVLALKDRSARQERLASLATLAAGVAHELGTPLGTIAVAAGELQRSAQALGAPAAALEEDAALIRQEVRRCRDILESMGDPSGSLFGEDLRPLAWGELQASLAQVAGSRLVCRFPAQAGDPAPVKGLMRTARALVLNALEADPGPEPVEVEARAEADRWILRVADHGKGMVPEVLARAGEPFFTTKGPGQGMGLGLFLARTFAEQLGGGLDIRSAPGRGTQVELRWPRALHG